jgi:hypothetical protein
LAIAPLSAATKPIKSIGLFDAAGGQTYDQWAKLAKPGDAMPSIAPAQINDSMADKVTEITSADSPLMRAAKTEGLKVANRRGMLNSSLAAGTTQRAMLDAALPIASQDAATAANKNAAARAFEYSMAAQDDSQAFAGTQADLDRKLSQAMQTQSIDAAKEQQIRAIASQEGIAAADRALTREMQSSAQAFEASQAALTRDMQEKLAQWDLNSADRNAAATMVTQMESLYQQRVSDINANTNLDADTRTKMLTSAKNLRDSQLDMVQQLYDVDLDWADIPITPATAPAASQSGGTVLCTHFHARGRMSDALYAADLAYAAANIDAVTLAGYHAWAVPLVRWLETDRRPIAEAIVGFFVIAWAQEMAWRMKAAPRGSWLGKALIVLGEPLCGAVGLFLQRRSRARTA